MVIPLEHDSTSNKNAREKPHAQGQSLHVFCAKMSKKTLQNIKQRSEMQLTAETATFRGRGQFHNDLVW